VVSSGLIHSPYTFNEVITRSAFLAFANKVRLFEKFARCSISGVIVWNAAIISLCTSSWVCHVCARRKLWYSPRQSNRSRSNLTIVPTKRSDHPDQSISLENGYPEFLSARIMCGNSIMLKNQSFPLSERNILQKMRQWLILYKMGVRIKMCRKKVNKDLKIVYRNVTKTMQQKKFLNSQEYLSLCLQILPTRLSTTDIGVCTLSIINF